MFPEAACFKVRLTSTVSFDLSVRHDECDDSGNAGGDFASVCVLGSEKWQSMNTDSLWLMGWTGFIKPMNIERTVWPFLPLHLQHLHTARTYRIMCFALVWTGGGSCSWFQFYIYIYIYLFIYFFGASHQFLSRTVGCMWSEDASYILAFIKKETSKLVEQKLKSWGWKQDFKADHLIWVTSSETRWLLTCGYIIANYTI